MNKALDIHNYQRTLDRIIERISKGEKVSEHNKKISLKFSEHNKKIALNFRDDLLSENLSISKTARYLQDVIWLNKRLNGMNFDEVTKEDVKRIVGEINQEYSSEWT
jgi:hypothetical protein